MEDKEIIDLYFARNENAISETAEKYGNLIKYIIGNILHNNSDTEECASDTYLAAWDRIPPAVPNSLKAFLGRIARNIALNRYDYYTAEKRSRETEVRLSELGDIISHSSIEDEFEVKETARLISIWLRGKSHTKRVVFVRRYWYGDSIPAIAEFFGFSESKVKSMLMRMRRELKKYLERQETVI